RGACSGPERVGGAAAGRPVGVARVQGRHGHHHPVRRDRRHVLAQWPTNADNPFFARSLANRIWFHVMGRGIVDPVDDFRDSNPSANDELLNALASDLASNRFDIKHLLRVVLNSRTYQLSAQTNDFDKDDNKYFSHAVTRLLTAEQLLDAI